MSKDPSDPKSTKVTLLVPYLQIKKPRLDFSGTTHFSPVPELVNTNVTADGLEIPPLETRLKVIESSGNKELSPAATDKIEDDSDSPVVVDTKQFENRVCQRSDSTFSYVNPLKKLLPVKGTNNTRENGIITADHMNMINSQVDAVESKRCNTQPNERTLSSSRRSQRTRNGKSSSPSVPLNEMTLSSSRSSSKKNGNGESSGPSVLFNENTSSSFRRSQRTRNREFSSPSVSLNEMTLSSSSRSQRTSNVVELKETNSAADLFRKHAMRGCDDDNHNMIQIPLENLKASEIEVLMNQYQNIQNGSSTSRISTRKSVLAVQQPQPTKSNKSYSSSNVSKTQDLKNGSIDQKHSSTMETRNTKKGSNYEQASNIEQPQFSESNRVLRKSMRSQETPTVSQIQTGKYICYGCNLDFKLDRLLCVSHFKSEHVENDMFVCPHCPRKYESQHSLNRHMKENHRKQQEEPTENNTKIELPEKYECEVCGERMKRCHKVIFLHHETHKKAQQVQRGVECSICHERFDEIDELRQHLVIHLKKKLVCKFRGCGAVFVKNGNLQRHAANHEEADKPFACELCPAKYVLKSSLSRHEKTVH